MKKKVSCKNRINPYFQFAKSEGNICKARGGSRAAATSRLHFAIILKGFQPIVTKHSILDVAAALDPSLIAKREVLITL